MNTKKLSLIVLFVFLAIPVMAGDGTRGIFSSSGSQSTTATLSASSSTDTETGYLIKFPHASNLGGDLTIVINSTLNSGSYPTCTVYVRKYYDSDLGYSDWFSVGTFSSDGTHDFNVATSSYWFYCMGYQVKVSAATGTFNISLIGKAFVR